MQQKAECAAATKPVEAQHRKEPRETAPANNRKPRKEEIHKLTGGTNYGSLLPTVLSVEALLMAWEAAAAGGSPARSFESLLACLALIRPS